MSQLQKKYKEHTEWHVVAYHTELYFPVIDFSDQLPAEERIHLTKMNQYIRDTLNSIVERDPIHWTTTTARAILDHWIQNLNFQGPSNL